MSTVVLCRRTIFRAALAGTLAAAAVSAACRPPAAPTALPELAEAYVRITLQLAQHRPNLVDAWIGPDAWRPGPRVPVADLRTQLDALIARVNNLRARDVDPTDIQRLGYLQGQLRALALVTRRLLGETTPFAAEVEQSFGRPLPPYDEPAIKRAHAALDVELAGAEPLAERYQSFRRSYLVPTDRAERVFEAAIDACKAATTPHITLPGDQAIELEFDAPIEWDAYAQYLGGHRTKLRIASRAGHDVAALLHMACHETYAGHHTQHVWIDDALVKGRGWAEFQLSPAFGPHLLITEGAAEAAVDLTLPEARRAAIYRDRLLPLAGLDGDGVRLARVETLAATLESAVPALVARYLDNAATAAETASALSEQVLLPAPDQYVAFAERHRSAAVVYPIGKAAVGGWIARTSADAERWRRLQDIFTRKPFTLE